MSHFGKLPDVVLPKIAVGIKIADFLFFGVLSNFWPEIDQKRQKKRKLQISALLDVDFTKIAKS